MHIFFVCFVLFILYPSAVHAHGEMTREQPMAERTSLYIKYDYTSPNKKVVFPYYILGPEKLSSGIQYPLIVILHGRTGKAYGGYVLADEVLNKGMPAFVLVPVMPEKVVEWTGDAMFRDDVIHPKPIDHVAILTKEIMGKLPIDPDRVYVTGYSMGGGGAFGAIYYYPDLFAAALPIAGGWYPQHAKAFINKPMWVFHGSNDKSSPTHQSRDMVKAIRNAGGKMVLYTEYRGVAHNSWYNAYAEPKIWTWLLSQKKSR